MCDMWAQNGLWETLPALTRSNAQSAVLTCENKKAKGVGGGGECAVWVQGFERGGELWVGVEFG